MKWYSQRFLQRLRRRVWREAQTRPAWRKAAWRNRLFEELPRMNEPVLLSVVGFGVPWLFIFIAIGIKAVAVSWALVQAPFIWLIVIWWALVVALGLAIYLPRRARGELGISALTQYPVTSLQVWDVFFAYVFRTSLWLLYDAAVIFGFACHEAHVRPVVWFAALFAAVALWASALALVVVLYSRRWPSLAYPFFAMLVFAGGPLLVILPLKAGHLTPAFIRDVHSALVWCTPPGWACQLAEWLTGERVGFPFAAVGLLVAFIVLAIPYYRRIRERYTFWPQDDPAPSAPQEKSPADSDAEIYAAYQARAIEQEVEQRVKSGAFLLPRIRQRSDSFSRRIIPTSPRGEAIIDFLSGGRAYWAKAYLIGASVVLMAPLLGKVVKLFGADTDDTGVVVAVASLVGLLIATLYSGQMMRPVAVVRQPCPVSPLALLPIAPREMSNVILRVTVPRLVAALPLWLLAGVWVSFAFPEIPLSGLRLGSLVWLAILMLQPVPAVLRYSVGVRRSGLSILALLLLFYSLAGAAGGMVYLVVMRAAWGWQVAACAVIGLVSWGIGTVYQRYLEPRLDMVMSWEIGNRQRDQRRV